MTERSFNLVVPLAHKATDMRSTDTAGSRRARMAKAINLTLVELVKAGKVRIA